jgi:hypothetical protein
MNFVRETITSFIVWVIRFKSISARQDIPFTYNPFRCPSILRRNDVFCAAARGYPRC